MNVGDRVWVPVDLLPNPERYPYALRQLEITRVHGKRVAVSLEGGQASPLIPKSRLHRLCGVVVVRVGDFQTETTTLDPLAKSVTQFLRLLLEESAVRLCEVRSREELAAWWAINAAAYTHLILIGHGEPNGVLFGVGGLATAATFGHACNGGGGPKTLISLACKTGRKDFSKELSQRAQFSRVIAPFHSVHAAIASQFVQTYLASHLVKGRTPKIAWRNARQATPGTDSFRMWVHGTMETTPDE